ncbi:MAG: MarR family transcriptional regulator, partial [Methanobacterium paludis]|nr:MarR family transcriptional regulator [Methanobacterium paludis]
KLEDKGFISRTLDPENRRKYLIFLTEKGEQTVPKIRGIERKWEKVVCEGLSDEEHSQLLEFLNVLAKNSIEKFKNHS